MPARLQTELYDSPKIAAAAELLGGHFIGEIIALGFFAKVLMYCDRHLSDGVLPRAVLKRWAPRNQACKWAESLAEVGLLDRIPLGYRVHNFAKWNRSKAEIEAYRERERNRKALGVKRFGGES